MPTKRSDRINIIRKRSTKNLSRDQRDILYLVSRKPAIESSFKNPSLRPRAELCRRHLDKLYCSGFGAAFKNRRAKTPADIIKDNPQAPTETEIRVFPRHLTGHPYWTPFIPFYVDLYEDDWSSEPFKKSSGRKNRTPNRKVAPKT